MDASNPDVFASFDSASITEIIDEARNGRMFILIDHENRENEGDLVIPAQMATPDAINFMAMYGRGLICLAMESKKIEKLGLPQMAKTNSSRHETAFTVSIDAREGVTTGISAYDRAHTVAIAIKPGSGPAEITTPGHVFPLRSKDGGVLVRAGHTEAAVDIARLADLAPAGVICEIMNDDGTMSRLPDLINFARRHDLKIGTISNLISYRHRHDNLVQETASDAITSSIGGEWSIRIFRDEPDSAEHIVITKGVINDNTPVMVRMHVLDPLEDILALNPARWNQVSDAMTTIAEEGRGVIVLLRDSSPNLISNKLCGSDAPPKELREYGIGAQILSCLGISKIIMLTNSVALSPIGLEGYGISIVGTRPII